MARYKSDLTRPREEVATVLRDVADGLTAGSVRVGEGDRAVVTAVPDEVGLEVELETDDDEVSLELELEWEPTEGQAGETPTATEETVTEPDERVAPVEAGTPLATLARFELFRDRAGEYRWRLVHRNGNVVATGGEGYTRKHNARKGLRSVMENAPGAAVVDDSDT